MDALSPSSRTRDPPWPSLERRPAKPKKDNRSNLGFEALKSLTSQGDTTKRERRQTHLRDQATDLLSISSLLCVSQISNRDPRRFPNIRRDEELLTRTRRTVRLERAEREGELELMWRRNAPASLLPTLSSLPSRDTRLELVNPLWEGRSTCTPSDLEQAFDERSARVPLLTGAEDEEEGIETYHSDGRGR